MGALATSLDAMAKSSNSSSLETITSRKHPDRADDGKSKIPAPGGTGIYCAPLFRTCNQHTHNNSLREARALGGKISTQVEYGCKKHGQA
jgi:hypothetical protein